MDKTVENLLTNMLGDGASMFGGMVESMKNIALARPITLQEPAEIEEAIKMYEERIRLLKSVKSQGFATIAEYNKYKEAEELIAKHKQKMETQPDDNSS